MNILKGITVPSGSLGVNGDLYFDTAAGKIYLKAEFNTWQLLGSFNFGDSSSFVASDITKWTGGVSPASIQEALDQLASRTYALENP